MSDSRVKSFLLPLGSSQALQKKQMWSLSNSGHKTAGTVNLGISPPFSPSSAFPPAPHSPISSPSQAAPETRLSRDRKRTPDSRDACRLLSNRLLPRPTRPSPAPLRKRRWYRPASGRKREGAKRRPTPGCRWRERRRRGGAERRRRGWRSSPG